MRPNIIISGSEIPIYRITKCLYTQINTSTTKVTRGFCTVSLSEKLNGDSAKLMIEPSGELATIGGKRPPPSRISGVVVVEVNSFNFSLVNAVGFIKDAVGSLYCGVRKIEVTWISETNRGYGRHLLHRVQIHLARK